MNTKLLSAILLSGALLLPACAGGQQSAELSAEAAQAPVTAVSEMFTDRDLRADYPSDSTLIKLSGSTVECDDENVRIDGSGVTVTGAGTYILSGILSDGAVTVDAGEDDKVQLVLDGVSIVSSGSGAIYIRQADKVFITLAPDSDNTLSGGEASAGDDGSAGSLISSRADLSFNGSGSLKLRSDYAHGIDCGDDLVFAGGSYDFNVAGHAVSAENSIRIAGGSFTLSAGKDAFHAAHDSADKGFIYIAAGSFTLNTGGDGLSASGQARIDGGEFDITAGGGSAGIDLSLSSAPSGRPGREGNAAPAAEENSASESTKGVKADGDVIISGGIFKINSADDALHSGGDLSVTSGSFDIATGDDAVHAGNTVSISGGTLNVSKSNEGIEGIEVYISGGDTRIVSADDGINAAGGNDRVGPGLPDRAEAQSVSGSFINISGGTIYIDAGGDGLDSNGTISVSGGEIYVAGSQNDGNSAMDYEISAEITGGSFIAVGSSGMALNFSSAVNQGSIMVFCDTQNADSAVSLLGEDGSTLLSWSPGKVYSSLVISCPDIQSGKSFTVNAGSYSTEISMDSLIHSAAEGMSPMRQYPGGRTGTFESPGDRPAAPDADGASPERRFPGSGPLQG